jgi:acetyl-CoA C-acetyltransferase
MSVEELSLSGPKNRMLAFPYNKWDNSQWNVDQAGALVLCSVDEARRRQVPEDRWVFPHAIVESNHMVPVSQRDAIHRSPGFAVASRRAFQLSALDPQDVDEVDLYSCFPVAVATQMDEIGLDPSRQPTITGGMAFGGGPLNNYVVQSTVAMVQRLRERPGSTGLVTAISGIITKQGVSLWSTSPPASGFHAEDVSTEVAEATERRVAAAWPAGGATLITYTMVPSPDGGGRVIVIAERADGTRAVASTEDRHAVDLATAEELIGRSVKLDGGGGFRLT